MNQKVLTVLAMVGLVLLGFFGGFFTHRSMTRSHFKRVVRLGTERGFSDHLYRVLAVDSLQRQALDPIVERYAHRMEAHFEQSRRERRAILDSLQSEMDTLLNPDQRQRLERFLRRMERRPKPGFRGRHGQPPPQE